MTCSVTRRRFITISAAALATGLAPCSTSGASASSVRWQGVAMGAQAELILNHPDKTVASAALQLVRDEIRRLEKVFSLYDPESSLCQLNRGGVLDAPPIDLVRCLSEANQISQITDGTFDVTVQPLWDLYARHFASERPAAVGPDKADIDAVKKTIDFRAVQNESHRMGLVKPHMAITLNGIAPGYITDRVAELLKAHGFNNVLIDLGEVRGFGHRDDGSDWRVGINAPDGSGDLIRQVDLRNKAIATSGGYGTRFSADGAHHHLFDPRTGNSTNLWTSVSVIADDATRADALSTAFSSLPVSSVRHIADALNVSVIASDGEGTMSINT